jgi:hypothetical protein
MRIDFNRICKLAGINDNSGSRSYLNEGADHGKEQEEMMHHNEGDSELHYEGDSDLHGEGDSDLHGEGDMTYMMEEDDDDASEGMMEDEDEDAKEKKKDEEVVEVNISELMSEIRRAKKLIKINEQNARREHIRKQQLQENKLKRVIAREVESVLSEMQSYDEYDSEWVYGNIKPRRSRKGYSAQGSFIPGVGFRRR